MKSFSGQCLIPSIPDATLNGQPDKREGVWARHGTVLNYQCKSGLVPDDTRPVRCNNGTWTSQPKCTPGKIPTDKKVDQLRATAY